MAGDSLGSGFSISEKYVSFHVAIMHPGTLPGYGVLPYQRLMDPVLTGRQARTQKSDRGFPPSRRRCAAKILRKTRCVGRKATAEVDSMTIAGASDFTGGIFS
jgi:hypothetical protein